MDGETWKNARPIVFAGLILIAVVLAILIGFQLRQLLAVFFLGFVLGLALNPLVDFLAKYRVPKIASVLFVYLCFTAAFAVFAYYAVSEITRDTVDFEIESLREDYEELREGTSLPASAEIEDAIRSSAPDFATGLAGEAFTFASAALSFFTVLFVALLFTVTQGRMKAVVLTFIPPSNRERAESILGKLAVGVRGYLRGELVAMLAIGIITYIGLSILGIRLALVLAFFAFLMELFPLIGPWIAFIPAFLVALTDGFWTAVQVSLLYLGIQMFENYLITPVVHGRESQVPALLILAALLVGGALMGIIGALIAIPIAVMLHILFFELVVPWTEERYGAPAPPSVEESA